MLRIKIITLLICFISTVSFAQDTLKKPRAVKPHHIYKYRGDSYRQYKLDSAAKAGQQKAPVQPTPVQQAVVRPDTRGITIIENWTQ